MQCISNVEVRLIYAILVILVWGVDGGMNLAVSERTLFKLQSICLKLRTFMCPNFPFLSSFVGKRHMLDMASEEENMYL